MTTCNSIRSFRGSQEDLFAMANEQALSILGLLFNQLLDDMEQGAQTPNEKTHIAINTVMDILDRARRGVQ